MSKKNWMAEVMVTASTRHERAERAHADEYRRYAPDATPDLLSIAGQLAEAAREMNGPHVWWDADTRTCNFCSSRKFDASGLLIHKSDCNFAKFSAALAAWDAALKGKL